MYYGRWRMTGRTTGKFAAILLIALAAATAAGQARASASISGQVRDSAGNPLSGVSVMLFTTTSPLTTVTHTDKDGRFSIGRLVAATYHVQAIAPDYLPALRQNVALHNGAHLIVNVTLNTLAEAISWLPPRKNSKQDDEDWKWTLRSGGNRPVLRVVDGSPVVISSSDSPDDRTLKARVAFLTSSESHPFSQSGEMTAFNVESSIFGEGRLSLKGDLGYNGGGAPWTVMRAAYSHQAPDGSKPELALTVRNFRSPSPLMPEGGLQAVALSAANTTALLDFVELQYGGEFQAVNFMGRANAIRPFGALEVHLGPQTLVEYRYSTSRPTTRLAKGFDSAPADLSESDPRLSLVNGEAQLERARHQEIAVSRRLGQKTTLEVAAYSDRIVNLVLTGIGDLSQLNDNVLPDATSGTFATNGGTYETRGLRVVAQRRFVPDLLTATVDFAMGGSLDLADDSQLNSHTPVRNVTRQSVAWKLEGRAPRTGTRWIASYTWLSGRALTPVDMFNASPGQADPYLSFFVRQPLPSFVPAKMEAQIGRASCRERV